MFDQLVFVKNPFGGIQAQTVFNNGYGVSVINGGGAYTNGADAYELAVYGKGGEICYDTPITDDVLGHLSADEVSEVMQQHAALPSIV
jgi:hypothetical protein